jgi:hypothetical protein
VRSGDCTYGDIGAWIGEEPADNLLHLWRRDEVVVEQLGEEADAARQ